MLYSVIYAKVVRHIYDVTEKFLNHIRRAGAIGQQYRGFEWLLFKRIDNIALLGINERLALS